MKTVAAGLLLVAVAVPSRAELPELYRKVAGVHWVVSDLERVKAGWAKLGFPVQDMGEVTASGSYMGQYGSSRFRIVQARLAGAEVLWIQPLESESGFAEHLARHGDGVFSILYAVPTREALDAEIARLGALGVGVLQRGELATPLGRIAVVHMDTAAEGKYVLGLVLEETPHADAAAPPPQAAAPATAIPLKLSQYAIVVRSLDKVSAYWEKLGFPKMEVTHPGLTDLVYRGQPGKFDQRLGWHRHGTVTWEWIEPLAGPTVYEDFLKEHGEGVHHIAFDVPDMDAAGAFFTSHGAAIVQSGAWGEKGKPGSGRFAYAATDAFGGLTTELLWNLR
jgi:catechol 2,3-dioxygenase-like lactoylglutathione lyase family enzyme